MMEKRGQTAPGRNDGPRGALPDPVRFGMTPDSGRKPAPGICLPASAPHSPPAGDIRHDVIPHKAAPKQGKNRTAKGNRQNTAVRF